MLHKIWKLKKAIDDLYWKYKDIFSLQQNHIGHAKLLTMDIDTGGQPPIVQKPYMLPLTCTQWIPDELRILESIGII